MPSQSSSFFFMEAYLSWNSGKQRALSFEISSKYILRASAGVPTLPLIFFSVSSNFFLKSANKDKELEKCESDLYALVGTTKSGVADFRKKFEETEKKINGKVGTPADARKMYFDEISKDKARCLPEFQDRYASMKKKLEDWEGMKTPEACYTVVKGDCLWKISKMKYGSPYYWPAIWDANKNGVANADALKNARHKKVTNPNLIYPGQCMKIPTLTDAQKKEAEMKSKKYRKTRKVKSTTDVKTDVKKDEKKDVKKDEKKDVKKDEKKDVKK